MVLFADSSSPAPCVPGWTMRALRRRYLPYAYAPLAPPPAGRCALRAGAAPPPVLNGSERVVVYRKQSWGPHAKRDHRWYMPDGDEEKIEELLTELMDGDDESYLARTPEYADAEDHVLFCQVTFRLFAKGPIVERLEALTLLDPKADGGFFVGELGPFFVDFPDRDRRVVLRLEELPPQLGEEYVAHLLREAGFCVESVVHEPAFRGFTRDSTMLATLRLPPNVAPPQELELRLRGHDIIVPLVCISNRSIAVETRSGAEADRLEASPFEADGSGMTVSFPDDDADASDGVGQASDAGTSESHEPIPPAFVVQGRSSAARAVAAPVAAGSSA